MSHEFDLPIAWTPEPDALERANVTIQMRKYGINSYEEFLKRSFSDPDWFWRAFFEDAGLKWHTPYEQTLDLSKGKPWARWFVNGKLNWTQMALDQQIEKGRGEEPALRFEGEEGEQRVFTFSELLRETEQLASALRSLGVKEGDAVGLFLPFIPEAAIGLLAISRMGAVAVPLFSGFGPEPIAMRLNDAEAKVLILADGCPRRGKVSPMKAIADDALRNAPSVQKTLVVRRAKCEVSMLEGRDLFYDEAVRNAGSGGAVSFYDSDQPTMIIYTSGTTGKPKGALHVHSGFPIKAAQDMFHLFDVKPGDTISWLTDLGWMMGPWLIMGSLILGASVFMYDGAPDFPAPDRAWEMVERHGVTHLGVTPTLIRALMRVGEEFPRKHEMRSLRAIGSTGEPWNPESWRWTLENVGKNRAPILNYSGGTEVSGGILGCVPFKPLKPACFNSLVPGMDARVVSEEGAQAQNEIGRLVVNNVNPGMTRGFWKDPARYEETYWQRFAGVWDHGDLALRDPDGFYFILGRSDDTLKIAGKRVGPAEIESVLAEHPAVLESAVIGVPDDLKGQAAVAFSILRPGVEGTAELEKELLTLVGQRMGKPLTPKAVKFVTDLPKTRNAKIMRRVIKAAFLGQEAGDLSALENPQAVEQIKRTGAQS